MSNKYKTAMDKITLSDEMKKKIMAAAAEKPDNENQKKIKRFPFGHAMSLAACIALALIAAFAGGELYDTGLTPGNDITVPAPSETEHPFTDDNKDKSIDDSNNNINDSSIQPDIDSKKEDSMAAGRASVSKSNPEASAKAPVPPAATNEPTQNGDTSLMPNDGNNLRIIRMICFKAGRRQPKIMILRMMNLNRHRRTAEEALAETRLRSLA